MRFVKQEPIDRGGLQLLMLMQFQMRAANCTAKSRQKKGTIPN
jgi:hypothetical protein